MGFYLKKAIRNQIKEKSHFMSMSAHQRATEIMGTGIFRIPDPSIGALASKTVFAEHISYEEARIRSLNCLEGTWIPEEILSFESIVNSKASCGSDCDSSQDCEGEPTCYYCDPSDPGNWGCST